MRYEVRHYVPPPLGCFKYQRFEHVAAGCKGKQRHAGEHEYGKCAKGAKLKFCNHGGDHSTVYHRCESSNRAAEVR